MKFIEGYENKYSITSDGKVWSHIRNKFLKYDLRDKYYAVKLGKFGKKMSIHRLVALAFIPNLENKPYINHKDGNKLNNNVSNLEWCTARENTYHAQATGLMNLRTYPVFRRQKILSSEINKVCDLYKKGASVISIAEKYKVTRGAIYTILSNNNIKKRKYNV
ncbi:HNH endonuclease [Aliarcobacter cryaerophilus]|uniref:HNH endonuclease signature motif containing protein n=1 Tax=Aliarcobacter cryaerophilus TaxID=28198 RepID=UPI003DA4D1E2